MVERERDGGREAVPAPRSIRFGARAGLVLVAVLAAFGVLAWEARWISPWDGDPVARDYILVAALVWALTLVVRGWAKARRTEASAIGGIQEWWTATLVALSSGVLLGTVLFLTLMPLGRYDVRWRIYMAAMRSDLRDLSEVQEARRAQLGAFSTSLEELDFYVSDGLVLDLLGDADGWSARTGHIAMASSGFPEAACVVYGGTVGVDVVHRLPDGRIPPAADEPLCSYGTFDPYARARP